ncbi:hypothetical protein KFL_008790040 [Klebsormidium nitens]|uniref:SF3 helicase domain-containing protein n=1 Tax=Klebsormidium nitens TaxID=105231 RepID=A0A1Y1ITD1_KLENI|nr:hypothetical protein KFL_008790040 [Klebsormidium nitens]|eukprot:GAQ91907.1 hypothetical protein KFL_008790040 [Klebsormidium nitens]
MPAWLVDTINRGRSTGAAPSIAVPDSAPPGPAVDGCGEVDQNLASEDEPVQPTRPVELVAAGAKPVPFLQDGSLVRELQKLLKEKANDSSSTYGSSLPHGLYGTFYCFRTTGPRTCFFGREHSGSNNFNLLKRGRDVFYRCHGDLCSHEPVRKLGELTLEAGLQDATNEAVSPQDQMNLFRKYREQGKSQFLAFVAEVARDGNGEPFAGLAKIFSHIYKIEGRILNTGDRKTFFYWDGRGWVEDTCNKVLSVFAAQMGALLSWYGMEFVVLFKKLFADKLCESNPGLKDLDQATLQKHVQDPKNKLLRDECKQLAGNILPEIRFNVQDPTIVKKCLHYVVTDLYVSDLSSHMNENPLLVNFQNGVGYIPTGELMKPHPSHLCSLVAGGEYHAKPTGTRSKFKEFLLDIANNDEDVVRWKILYLGYGMSGYTDEEIVNFWWGEGGNGKGALKQAILAAWGEYAIICSKHIFMKTKDDTASAASSHLAQLKGVRFGLADELDDGQTINAATIKEQTGGGKISARELFEKMKNFIPTHKLVLLTNNKPRIPVEEVNAGLLRRIVLEPYLNQYVEDSEYNPNIPHHRRADVGLKMYLESKEGIEDVIRVAFEGARDWYKIRTAKELDERKATAERETREWQEARLEEL